MSDVKKYVWILLSKVGHDWLPVISVGYYGNESNVWAFPSKDRGDFWIQGNVGQWKLRKMRVKP